MLFKISSKLLLSSSSLAVSAAVAGLSARPDGGSGSASLLAPSGDGGGPSSAPGSGGLECLYGAWLLRDSPLRPKLETVV